MDKFEVLTKVGELKTSKIISIKDFNELKEKIQSGKSIIKIYNICKKLEKLGKLKHSNILTESEYDNEKDTILNSNTQGNRKIGISIANKILLNFINSIKVMLNYLLYFIKKIFSFKGRIGRVEYLLYICLIFILFGVGVDSLVEYENTKSENLLGLTIIYFTLMLYIFITANMKRLHDLGASGWWLILSWSIFFFAITGLSKGMKGENKYGK